MHATVSANDGIQEHKSEHEFTWHFLPEIIFIALVTLCFPSPPQPVGRGDYI